MLRFPSLWRGAFLVGTYLALVVVLIVLHQGGSRDAIVAIPVGVPVRLQIPALKIDVPIAPVGTTPEGNMDIPKGAWEAGWFNLGVKPGEKGNAVIAGHLDTAFGTAAVFGRLHELAPEDLVVVSDSEGNSRSFTVVRSVAYDTKDAPMHEIFGIANDSNLQLITCNGDWQLESGTYDKRLVVFTRIKEDAVPTAASASLLADLLAKIP